MKPGACGMCVQRRRNSETIRTRFGLIQGQSSVASVGCSQLTPSLDWLWVVLLFESEFAYKKPLPSEVNRQTTNSDLILVTTLARIMCSSSERCIDLISLVGCKDTRKRR